MNKVTNLINFYNRKSMNTIKDGAGLTQSKHIDKLTTLSNSDLISI